MSNVQTIVLKVCSRWFVLEHSTLTAYQPLEVLTALLRCTDSVTTIKSRCVHTHCTHVDEGMYIVAWQPKLQSLISLVEGDGGGPMTESMTYSHGIGAFDHASHAPLPRLFNYYITGVDPATVRHYQATLQACRDWWDPWRQLLSTVSNTR